MSNHEWKILYEKALNESDLSKLHECVIAAETAIFARSLLLNDGQDHGSDAQLERTSLRQASNGLLQLKTEKLKWPTIGPTVVPE